MKNKSGTDGASCGHRRKDTRIDGSHTKGGMSKLERNNTLAALLATEMTLENTINFFLSEKEVFKLLAIILSAIHKRDFSGRCRRFCRSFCFVSFFPFTSKLQFFFKHEVL